jgi:hypothetical protein
MLKMILTPKIGAVADAQRAFAAYLQSRTSLAPDVIAAMRISDERRSGDRSFENERYNFVAAVNAMLSMFSHHFVCHPVLRPERVDVSSGKGVCNPVLVLGHQIQSLHFSSHDGNVCSN